MGRNSLWRHPILFKEESPRRSSSNAWSSPAAQARPNDASMTRTIALILLVGMVSPAVAQSPPFQPVATISQIMSAITLPYSDALVYIQRSPPKTDRDWELLEMQALMLAESGNLLM